MSPLPRLILVTDRQRTAGRDLVECLVAAVHGGLRWIQIREKDLDTPARSALVTRIRDAVAATTDTPVQIVVNGDPTSAGLVDGLHLAADQPAPSPETRKSLRLFGRSIHDEPEARSALTQQPDYLILGTLYPTPSKPGHPGSGPQLLQRISPITAPTPLLAIGGITTQHIPDLLSAGAHGIAVTSTILQSPDPTRTTKDLLATLSL